MKGFFLNTMNGRFAICGLRFTKIANRKPKTANRKKGEDSSPPFIF